MNSNNILEQKTISELQTERPLNHEQLYILHKLIILKYSFEVLWPEIEDNFTSKQVQLIREKVSLITSSIAKDSSFAFASDPFEEK